MKIRVKKFASDAQIPEFKTTGAAGADMFARETVVAKPGEATLVKLGVGFDIPEGHLMTVSLRSSTPKKKGLFIPNGTGIIDCDYKGEFMLLVAPLGNEEVVIEKGERIAQTVLIPARTHFAEGTDITGFEEVEVLEDSERGEGGFGSTGH